MVSSSTNTADKLKAAEYNPIFQYLEKPVQVENFENLKKTGSPQRVFEAIFSIKLSIQFNFFLNFYFQKGPGRS